MSVSEWVYLIGGFALIWLDGIRLQRKMRRYAADTARVERVRAELDALASEWADPANQQEQYTEAVVCNCVGRIRAALDVPQGGEQQ